MNESQLHKLIQKTLQDHELHDATDGIFGFLLLLWQHHVADCVDTLDPGGLQRFSDGLGPLTGRRAISLAESIRDYARVTAPRYDGLAQSSTTPDEAQRHHRNAAQIRCVADLLTKLCKTWDRERQRIELKSFRPDGHYA